MICDLVSESDSNGVGIFSTPGRYIFGFSLKRPQYCAKKEYKLLKSLNDIYPAYWAYQYHSEKLH